MYLWDIHFSQSNSSMTFRNTLCLWLGFDGLTGRDHNFWRSLNFVCTKKFLQVELSETNRSYDSLVWARGLDYMVSRGLFQPQLSCNSVIFKLLGVIQLSSSKYKCVGYCRSGCVKNVRFYVYSCVFQLRDWTLLPILHLNGWSLHESNFNNCQISL